MFILAGDGSEPQDPAGAPVKARQGARGYQKIAGKLLPKSTVQKSGCLCSSWEPFLALVFVAPSFLSFPFLILGVVLSAPRRL